MCHGTSDTIRDNFCNDNKCVILRFVKILLKQGNFFFGLEMVGWLGQKVEVVGRGGGGLENGVEWINDKYKDNDRDWDTDKDRLKLKQNYKGVKINIKVVWNGLLKGPFSCVRGVMPRVRTTIL